MLYDRDYMRDGDRPAWRSPVVVLLIVLGVVFLLECVLQVYARTSLGVYCGLSYPAVARHQYWRIFTYQFLHSAPMPFHLLMNGLALWFFGRPVVAQLGVRRFWVVYFASGFVGALFELGSQSFHGMLGWTVGASACVAGLISTFCFLSPSQPITVFVYFLPVTLRPMTLFWILFGFSVFGTVFPNGDVAHAAHLGGLLAGVGYVKFFVEEDGLEWLRRFVPGRPAAKVRIERAPLAAVPAGSVSERPPVRRAEDESSDDFIRREVDPILDKISAHGIQSLTERERRILERARERMKGLR